MYIMALIHSQRGVYVYVMTLSTQSERRLCVYNDLNTQSERSLCV